MPCVPPSNRTRLVVGARRWPDAISRIPVRACVSAFPSASGWPMQGLGQRVGHSERRGGGDGGERTRKTRASVPSSGKTRRRGRRPMRAWAWKPGVRHVAACKSYGPRSLFRSRWQRWGSRQVSRPAGWTSARSGAPNCAGSVSGTRGADKGNARTHGDGICRDREYNKGDGCGTTLSGGRVDATMPSPLAGLRSRKVRLRPCFVVVLRSAAERCLRGCRNCHNNGQGVAGSRRIRTPPQGAGGVPGPKGGLNRFAASWHDPYTKH